MKQLGAQPVEHGTPFCVPGQKGDDPQQWPADLRIREYPVSRQMNE
jgi:hypothetical protein